MSPCPTRRPEAGSKARRTPSDEATNSLVVTAAEEEWAGILALVEQLDSEEYDASLQLAVLPLVYADARSVARAINDAFRPQVEAARRGGRRPAARLYVRLRGARDRVPVRPRPRDAHRGDPGVGIGDGLV